MNTKSARESIQSENISQDYEKGPVLGIEFRTKASDNLVERNNYIKRLQKFKISCVTRSSSSDVLKINNLFTNKNSTTKSLKKF